MASASPTTRPSLRAPVVRGALALALVVVLFLAFSGEAVQLSPQGNQFVRSAHALRTHGELQLLNDKPLSFFPPLYAWLLAGLAALGLAPIPAIVLVNAVVLAGGLWAFRELAGRMGLRSARAATVLYAVLASNVYWFRMVRPDAIVPVLAMATALGLVSHAAGGGRAPLLLASAAAGAAALTRYMGLFTVLPMAVVGILLAPGRAGKRGRDLAWFLPLAIGPIALWLLRTWARTGYATGMSRTAFREQAAGTGLVENVVALAHTVALDLFGVRAMGVRSLVEEGGALPHPVLTGAAVAAGIALVAAAGIAGRRRAGGAGGREGGAAAAEAAPPADPIALHALRLVAAFTAIHAVALLVLWTAGNNDPIHTRFVAPLYWGLALLLFAARDRLAARGARPGAAALAGLAVLVGTVNLDKTVLLLGDSPSGTLIKKTLHRPDDLWVRDLAWDRPHFLLPVRGGKGNDDAAAD